MKPGDRAYHAPSSRGFTVAVVDPLTQRVCLDDPDREEWVPLAEVEHRGFGTRDDERAMLTKTAKLPGRRGDLARVEVGRQWLEGTWTK